MSQKVRSVRTRAHTAVKPYFFVCKNPFHDAWSSPDSSRKANPVRANLLQVLSAVAGMTVAAICHTCKDQADTRIEITSHALYQAVYQSEKDPKLDTVTRCKKQWQSD